MKVCEKLSTPKKMLRLTRINLEKGHTPIPDTLILQGLVRVLYSALAHWELGLDSNKLESLVWGCVRLLGDCKNGREAGDH